MTNSACSLFVILICMSCIKDVQAYIIDSQFRPACPSVRCDHGGTLQTDTCTCQCPPGYGGFFCRTEMNDTKWPMDKYSLLSSVFGCPEDSDVFGWKRGYVNMTVQTGSRDQRWKLPYAPDPDYFEQMTPDPHILGPYYLRTLQLNFCTRHDSKDDAINENAGDWPSGHYCVFKYGDSCPTNFSESQVTMAGYHLSWSDVDGTIPDVTVNDTTGEPSFVYCCHVDGDDVTSDDTNFPPTFPFILTKPNTSECMAIPSMSVSEERFDLVDEFGQFVFDGQHTMFTTTDDGYQRLNLCYYTVDVYEKCYYEEDGGFSYQGAKNVSKEGNPCVHWYDIPDDASDHYFKPHKNYVGDFNHNHCRTYHPYGDMRFHPWCFVNLNGHVTWEACEIPVCETDETLEVVGRFKPVYSVPERSGDLATNAVNGIHGGATFVGDRPRQKAWIQVDIEETLEVHAVMIYRAYTWFANNVRMISVHVSNDRWDFLNYGSLQCQNRRYPRKAGSFRFNCYRPIKGQYVTLRNFDDPAPTNAAGNYYRMEIAEIEVIVKRTPCSRRMGVVSGGIRDFQLGGSSELVTNVYDDGRLFSAGDGWCSGNTNNAYFEIDLIVPSVIDGLEIQGSRDGNTEPVREFYVEYSVHDDHLYNYTTPTGQTKMFSIDPDAPVEMMKRYLFVKPFVARKVRVHMVNPKTLVCLKFELIGCPKRVSRDLYCRGNDVTIYGYDGISTSVYWIEDVPHYQEGLVPCLARCDALPECAGVQNDRVLCRVFTSSRYNAHFRHWFVTKVNNLNSHVLTKLCVKDVSEYTNCNQVVREPIELASPSYPMYYGMLLDCRWTIEFPVGSYIRIEILDLLLPQPTAITELRERGYYDVNLGSCSDRLQMDNLTIDHTNQQYYSRSVLVSTSNHIVIGLTSCARYAMADDMSGFKMKITYSDHPGCGLTSSGLEKTCTATTGILASPGYPTPFSSTEIYTWTITGQPGQYILLTFKVIDMQSPDAECTGYRVSVMDVARFEPSQGWDPLLGHFCSLNKPDGPLKSSWEMMKIDFKSGFELETETRQGNGFMAEYLMLYQVQDFTDEDVDGCDDGWETYEDSCYNLLQETDGLTWIEAEKRCTDHSGHLVSLQSSNETNYLHYLLTNRWSDRLNGSQDLYIGLRKTGDHGLFKDVQWSDGSPVTFTAWYQSSEAGTTQPDGLGNERCSFISLYSIHSINNWHDVPCAYDRISAFICEKTGNSTFQDTSQELEHHISQAKHPSMFVCDSEDIIHTIYTCDGTRDCTDGSDENCQAVDRAACTGYQFQCKDGRCIPADLLCDFRQDCMDGSDEHMCVYPDCNTDDEWRCTSGQCVHISDRCDVKLDCFDGSDERDCDTCDSTSFQCYDQTCTSMSRVCDSYYDCSGRFYEDEIQEDCNSNSRLQSCVSWYSIGQATNRSYSIRLGTNEGLSVECLFFEQDDEVFTDTVIHHQLETVIDHKSVNTLFTIQYTATDTQIDNLKQSNTHCSQYVRFDCSYLNSNNMYWVGNNGEERYNIRDEVNDCACPYTGRCNEACNCGIFNNMTLWYGMDHDVFLTDEAFITNKDELPIRSFNLPGMITNFKPELEVQIGPLVCRQKVEGAEDYTVCANGVLVSLDSVCMMRFDVYGDVIGCRDLSHLKHCDTAELHCPEGYTRCPNSYCIWSGLVCDGTDHCPNGEDEMNCTGDSYCSHMFHCRGSNLCIPTMNVCDGTVDCPAADDEQLCDLIVPNDCTSSKRSMTCNSLTSLLDSDNPLVMSRTILQTRVLKITTSTNLTNLDLFIGLTHLDLSSSGLTIIAPGQFDFAKNLVYLDLSNNGLTEIPPGAFQELKKVSFLNLKGNPLRKLSPNSFIGLESVKELDLSGFSLGRLKGGFFDGMDSLTKLNLTSSNIKGADDNAFAYLSSLTDLDLRQNEIVEFKQFLFSGLNSLRRLYVDSFTLCCIKPTELGDDSCFAPINEFSSCSDLLRNNVLSVSIWVIGILATLGNIGVLVIRFILDKNGLKKTYNIFVCNLSIADCLMGVYLVTLGIADVVFRGEYTWNDYQWRHGTICKLVGVISTVASECSVVFLCLITLDRLLVVKFPFGNVRIRLTQSKVMSLSVWLVVLLLACIPLIGEASYSWAFYTRSAVCLPLPLTRDRPLGYEYSVGLFIVFNFIAFMLIATAQIVIYMEISSTRSNVASKGRRVDISVARKLFFVAITDFMCWFPIGLMGMMALNGEVISGEVYAWIAVFVLPINSALNPFLYTLGTSITNMFNNRGGSTMSRGKSSRKGRESSKSVTEVVGSDMFVFGKFDAKDKRKMTLKRYVDVKTLTLMDTYKIARSVCKALEMLHGTEMVHGKISTENVMITMSTGKLNRVMLKSSPVVCMDEEDFKKDIDEFGCMLRALVKLVDKN